MTRKNLVSIRLSEGQVEDLHQTAQRLGQTPSQTAAMLVDEGLRRERFPQIEMRDTARGRRAYIKGTRLAVSFIVDVVRLGEAPEELAEDLLIPLSAIHACMDYAQIFHDEIDAEIAQAREFEAAPEKFIPGILIYRPNARSA